MRIATIFMGMIAMLTLAGCSLGSGYDDRHDRSWNDTGMDPGMKSMDRHSRDRDKDRDRPGKK